MGTTNPALVALRDNVTGAVERGEADAITEVRAGPPSGFDAAVAAIRWIRERDCDFLTVETVCAYSGATVEQARDALRQEMGPEWARQVWAGTARMTEELAADIGYDWIPGQVTVLLADDPRPPFGREVGRMFAVCKGRRWTRVHEYLSNGQLTARWFVDEASGEAREAEGARKPRSWRMGGGAAEFARSVVALANAAVADGR